MRGREAKVVAGACHSSANEGWHHPSQIRCDLEGLQRQFLRGREDGGQRAFPASKAKEAKDSKELS